MKVLVTGAAGFIGKKLCRMFRKYQHDVIELDKEEISLGSGDGGRYVVRCDIRDQDSMAHFAEMVFKEQGSIDACVHLAAIAAPRQAAADPQLAWETNVRGTHNVLAFCRQVGIKKVVFASSAHVYGISPKYLPTDEQHPLALLDTYTTTKILGEQLLELFHDNYGLSYTTCRLFNAYGPGQSPDYFMGVKLKEARAGGPLTLMNGEVTKDWVWVWDVVEALMRCTATDYVGPMNIGTGKETSLREIAGRIASAHGTTVIPDASKDASPSRMCADWSRAERVLGWKPQVSFEEGLRLTIADAGPGV